MTSNQIGGRLGLNMKRNEPRLKELEARFGVTRCTVSQAGAAGWLFWLAAGARALFPADPTQSLLQCRGMQAAGPRRAAPTAPVPPHPLQGRMLTGSYTAPEALLRQFPGAGGGPLRPEAGWLGAVVEAIQAGLDDGEPFPWPPQPRQPGAAAAAAAAPQGEQREQPAEPPAEPAGAAAAAPAPAAQQEQAQQEQAAAAAPPPEATAGRGAREYTVQGEQRYQRVLQVLATRGFLLASEMPQLLKARRRRGPPAPCMLSQRRAARTLLPLAPKRRHRIWFTNPAPGPLCLRLPCAGDG